MRRRALLASKPSRSALLRHIAVPIVFASAGVCAALLLARTGERWPPREISVVVDGSSHSVDRTSVRVVGESCAEVSASEYEVVGSRVSYVETTDLGGEVIGRRFRRVEVVIEWRRGGLFGAAEWMTRVLRLDGHVSVVRYVGGESGRSLGAEDRALRLLRDSP